MAHVIVERTFDEPLDSEKIAAMVERMTPCVEMHGLRHLEAYLSADGRRMVCLFEGPDAESVRIANRTAGMPFERIWTASIHEPPAK